MGWLSLFVHVNQIGTKNLIFWYQPSHNHQALTLHLNYPKMHQSKPASVSKMAHSHKMSDECTRDKICCGLNGTLHCSARLPPPATPVFKDYWNQVPFYSLVHVNTCDLDDIRCQWYLFVFRNWSNLIDWKAKLQVT